MGDHAARGIGDLAGVCAARIEIWAVGGRDRRRGRTDGHCCVDRHAFWSGSIWRQVGCRRGKSIVSRAQRILIFGGLGLAALGMLYGLHYAVFVEHQTLDRMGGSLAQGFVQAAQRDSTGAHSSIDQYAAVKYAYVREVDVHSHWIGVGMIMIVRGAAFRWVGFSERVRTWIAI